MRQENIEGYQTRDMRRSSGLRRAIRLFDHVDMSKPSSEMRQENIEGYQTRDMRRPSGLRRAIRPFDRFSE
jgi:hypothetical protein